MPRPHPVPAGHPWRLVAPWWRWSEPALPSAGRPTRPALQKFAGPGFIEGFLKDPQRSLVFDPVVDVVSNVDLLPAVSGGNLTNRLAALFATFPDGKPGVPTELAKDPTALGNVRRARLTPTTLRKLFQPVHDRFYLVVCELHCDMPGFPTPPRSEVCQAGFVVRRRERVVPRKYADEAAIRAQRLRAAEAGLAELAATAPLRPDLARMREAARASLAATGRLGPAIAEATAAVETQRAGLHDWFAEKGIGTRVEGWMPEAPGSKLGRWAAVADETADPSWPDEEGVGESVLPLTPLIPDPRNPGHDAAGRTIWFAMVPVASLEHDATGRARFDDVSTYEIRCFVRRHKPGCPRTGAVPDCHGAVVWSRATEPYRVAATFDPVGSANRPITIKMPDLSELAAQVAARPRGRQSPVRIVQPQRLSPDTSDPMKKGAMDGPGVCFFSIPLITIVALFVLNLFLPIVVLVFQLWFLLLFKFCIPPKIAFAGSLDAALAATQPSVDLDADFAITVDGTALKAEDLNDLLDQNLRDKFAADGLKDSSADLTAFSNNALGSMHRNLGDNVAAGAGADPTDPAGPADYGAALVYEPRREKVWQPVEGRG